MTLYRDNISFVKYRDSNFRAPNLNFLLPSPVLTKYTLIKNKPVFRGKHSNPPGIHREIKSNLTFKDFSV